ncbi:MAG TPA: hypothetical protein VGZ02_07095 [Candidatus Baltobacteraceae bacterium]|jgi:hypothetical protein|nr:hypothetical protein [Candidatus Baltobacteraceae bacterium]
MNVFGVIFAVLLLLQTAPATSAIPAAKTTAVAFSPGLMRKHVRIKGECWTESIASARADAYRCMAQNEIYDPCFKVDAREVACPTPKDVTSGTRISLTKPLPAHTGTPANTVWAMHLAGGGICSRGTGTLVKDFPFYCSGLPVCADPTSWQTGPPGHAVFVTCGTAKNAITVTNRSRYLVKTIYL